jgi:hypothetical protein
MAEDRIPLMTKEIDIKDQIVAFMEEAEKQHPGQVFEVFMEMTERLTVVINVFPAEAKK